MPAEYRLVFYDASGVKQADIVNYKSLAYTKQVGKSGLLRFALQEGTPIVAQIADKWQAEVWRRDFRSGIDWYVDFYGVFRDFTRQNKLIDGFDGLCPGSLDILRWRTVAWRASLASRSAFTSVAAETIAKTLVNYNATSLATTGNGRLYDGTFSGMTVTVQTDAASGNVVSFNCSNDNLLDALYRLSLIGGGDYDLIKVGPTTWDFRWYLGQRGIDRTATVLFATEYGNMIEPFYRQSRMDEKTVAVVGGEGKDENRLYRTRTGPNYSASNKAEVFVDSKADKTNAALDASGDAALEKAQAKTAYGFKIAQTPASAYGVHYCVGGVMGDLVTARYFGVEAAQKVERVTVESSEGKPDFIEVETRYV